MVIKAGYGVVCANLSLPRGYFAPCKGAWCGPCYKLEDGLFRVKGFTDDDGYPLCIGPDIEKQSNHKTARDGDHLMTTFQCELCHFRNITGRDPTPGYPPHESMMTHTRRVNLDAFWSRSVNTVSGHRSYVQRIFKTRDKFQIPTMVPPMGPFPLRDIHGMSAALAVLDKSQDATGKHEKHVQPNTYKKITAALGSLYQAGCEGLGEQVGVGDEGPKRLWITNGGMYTRFFTKFMKGIKVRTGSLVIQDKALTIELLKAMLEELETRYQACQDPVKQMEIARLGAFLVSNFCSALRGEEMMIVELAGTKNTLLHLNGAKPYFCMAINGKTKTNRNCGAAFKVPVAGVTQGTGLEPGKWMVRYVDHLTIFGVSRGYLFSKRGAKRSNLSDFADEFFELLEDLQEAGKGGIPADMKVREEYSLWRSIRRGVTAHAINQGVPEHLVNLINRWRSEKNRQAQSAKMIDIYTELEALLPTALRCSLAL